MDGLLFDTERLYREGWIAMAERFGQVSNPAFPSAVSGTNGIHMQEVVHRYYPAVDAKAFIQGCISYVDDILLTSVPEKPGVHEILEFLHAHGVKIAVASSSDREVIHHNMALTGTTAYFDAVVSGQEVTVGKPDPDIFLLAAERLGLSPKDCYVFEDSTNGILAGAAAGCATVMIPDLVTPTDELRVHCAGVYRSLLEAKQALERGEL